MNILVPDSWLREHLKTKATVKQIAEYLLLCSQSVEKINKVGSDFVYDIEITTNRPDCLSIYGIARELAAILPRFGIAAKLKEIPEFKKTFPNIRKGLELKIKLQKQSLCPRFTALIFDKVEYKKSPKLICDRLKKAGTRALNNIVDISNYLMLELGQPMHTFDYDKVEKSQMILRESKSGEKIVTLDGQDRELPKGTIIIEDGAGRIIDLCGIMGGQNSEVDEKTKRVLLFVQTYDPAKIRQSCQKLSFRTEAAQRFEKEIEPEGVILAMKKAMAMFEEFCGAKTASSLIDIYSPAKNQPSLSLSQEKLNQVIGIEIKLAEAKNILESLGFKVNLNAKKTILKAIAPHWRGGDIKIAEDLIEEVARIYGYHNLPSVLPQGELPKITSDSTFEWENKIKQALKYWGFVETANYSMISKESLKKAGFEPKKYLKLANPLVEDLVFMRPTLLLSLFQTADKNIGEESLKIFELSNVYLPQGKDKLPKENLRLAGALRGKKFFEAKGIVEAILEILGIKKVNFKPSLKAAEIYFGKQKLGEIGETKEKITFFDLNFNQLVKLADKSKKYKPINKYPAIIEDLSFIVPQKTLVGEMIKIIKMISPLIEKIALLDSFENSRTFRITYQHPKKNLNGKEIEKIRERIIKRLEIKTGSRLKS